MGARLKGREITGVCCSLEAISQFGQFEVSLILLRYSPQPAGDVREQLFELRRVLGLQLLELAKQLARAGDFQRCRLAGGVGRESCRLVAPSRPGHTGCAAGYPRSG